MKISINGALNGLCFRVPLRLRSLELMDLRCLDPLHSSGDLGAWGNCPSHCTSCRSLLNVWGWNFPQKKTPGKMALKGMEWSWDSSKSLKCVLIVRLKIVKDVRSEWRLEARTAAQPLPCRALRLQWSGRRTTGFRYYVCKLDFGFDLAHLACMSGLGLVLSYEVVAVIPISFQGEVACIAWLGECLALPFSRDPPLLRTWLPCS